MGGKKKRGHPDVDELLARPWCYYCERDFDDLKILISHQKAKHFKCERCGRRLNTAGGLSVHMNQVHKETLTSVDNSLPNRQGLEVEIFGMEGIPEDVAQAHNQRIIAGFYQAEAERRVATGNPSPGANAGGQPKKPKFESPAELKKRLAEHKARKEAERVAGASSGGNTPLDGAQNSPRGQSPSSFNASPYTAPQATYGGTQGAGYASFSQEPYSQPAAAYQQPYASQPPFSGPPASQFQPQYSSSQQYPAQPSFPPGGFQPPGQSYPGGPQHQSFGAGSPPGSFNSYQSPPSHTPPAPGGLPNRPPSLPPAPGLPQRPSFGAPAVAPFQMQQMHQGNPASFQGSQGSWAGNGWNGQDQKPAMSSAYPASQGYGDYSANASSVDDLVSGAARAADDIDEIIRMAEAGIKPPKKGEALPARVQAPIPEAAPTPVPETTEKTETNEKKSKKDKPTKMIYSDNEISPEEKMAMMPRYAFVPAAKAQSVLVDAATSPGVAGVVQGLE
ncbi:Uncharacterized protein BP5553_08787 [Venustampulla echinocandica]|uniref:Uncharacterized protein n=1 Tax=Venustampulla echinocandica TaxID=2656787 RepID=A0A370TF76_9HELO|nr:Uncharacterized protein BP5553_08787 [Venustampulla echinocandica]RDL33348.1 Uncharacterized protein BP5553_08787 [Venustampulla echinocandica]